MLIIDIRSVTSFMFRQVGFRNHTYEPLLIVRPCATSNKTSDTRYPDPDSGYAADADGCMSLDDDGSTYHQIIEQSTD